MQFRKDRAIKACEFMGPSIFKITEKDKKFTFQPFVKKANYLTHFDD